MNTVINYASGKPSNPLRGYSYVDDSKLRQSRQIIIIIIIIIMYIYHALINALSTHRIHINLNRGHDAQNVLGRNCLQELLGIRET